MAWKNPISRSAERCVEAASEVFVVILLGFVPFFIAVARFNYQKNEMFDFNTVFIESFNGGQLYLYAFSLFGTLMWLSLFNWQIPYTRPRIAIGFLLLLFGMLISGLGGVDPTFTKITNTTIISSSYWLYLIFVFLYFILILLSKQTPPTVSSTLHAETDGLLEQFNALAEKGK